MWRDAFHVPGPGPYVLTHSIGCAPKTHDQALRRSFTEPWHQQGGDAWGVWLPAIEEFRAALADLLGGAARDYCPQTNLSSGLAKLLPALPAAPTRPILLAAEDSFPSMVFALQQAGRGHQTRLIPRALDPAQIGTWEAALTEDVTVALVTHVHSNTGTVAPVAEIAALCRTRGIRCIVDIAQSAGILAMSVPQFGADAVLGSCVKWLCGGPGAGFLWLDPALLPQLEPPDVGWFSHADPFEFDVHSFRYAPDALRFWGGTPSVAPCVIAADSLRLLAEIGVDAIRAHNGELRAVFRAALPPAWRRRVALAGRGGSICLELGAGLPAVRKALHDHAIRVDYRGSVVRISFHIYNTAAEAAFIARCWQTL